MRILITGGSGFIGSNCAEFFCKKKINKVTILDNFSRSKLFKSHYKSVQYNWGYLKQFKNVRLTQGDIGSEKDVKNAIGKGLVFL